MMPANPFQLASGIFGTLEQKKLAAARQAVKEVDAALPELERTWKSRAWDALNGDEQASAAARAAKVAYDAMVERRQFAVAAAAELELQIEDRERRKHDKQRRSDRRALSAHLGQFRGALERCINLQVQVQQEFDRAMEAAQRAFVLLPYRVRSEVGNELSVEAVRGLMKASAVKIAQDLASVSPLPDPMSQTRLSEFTDWKTGETRPVIEHIERVIAGVKTLSFPEYEPAAVTVTRPAVEAGEVVVASPALLPPAGTPAEPSMIWRPGDFERGDGQPSAPGDEGEPEEADLEPLPEEVEALEPLPAFTRARMTAADEERLLREASI
jgi:hypothetical protein